MRKNEIPQHEDRFLQVDKIAKEHSGHKILIMHQGITEFNKFAGELQSTDLPKNFTYYAMGHLHDHDIKHFSHLNGPISYPGSIELTTSEGIKETAKGFCEVDISGEEAKTNWIKLDTRPQFSFKMNYDELLVSVSEITEKISGFERKPIVELKIQGEKIETEQIQTQISRLNSLSLRCFWRIISKQEADSTIFLDRPSVIDDELFRLSVDILGSEKVASFAIKEMLPILASEQIKEATQIVVENFERFRSKKK